jgi:hypothetical protein
MNDQDDCRRRLSSAEEGIERLYESLGPLVQRTLTKRFAVPPQEAQNLVREIFSEYVTRSPMVDDPKECLMAMAGESGRTWQRRNWITPPETGSGQSREMRVLLLIPEALAALPERVRKMVRLHYAENRTFEEIAAEMGVTAYYAEVAVMKAMATLRRIARSRGK